MSSDRVRAMPWENEIRSRKEPVRVKPFQASAQGERDRNAQVRM